MSGGLPLVLPTCVTTSACPTLHMYSYSNGNGDHRATCVCYAEMGVCRREKSDHCVEDEEREKEEGEFHNGR